MAASGTSAILTCYIRPSDSACVASAVAWPSTKKGAILNQAPVPPSRRVVRSARPFTLLLLTAVSVLLLFGCGQETDLFAGKWEGTGDYPSLRMEIQKSGEGTYEMATRTGDRVSLTLHDGALVGTTKINGDLATSLAVSSVGQDLIKTKTTTDAGGDLGVVITRVIWARAGSGAKPPPDAPAALSQADRAYMRRLSEGMAMSVKSVNLTSAAWEQGMITKLGVSKTAYRQLMRGRRLMERMASKWSPFPQPPSEELKPLMRKCGTAMSYGAHYVVESSKMFNKMSTGTVPSSTSADRMMAWYDKWRKAVRAVKAEYRKLVVEQ